MRTESWWTITGPVRDDPGPWTNLSVGPPWTTYFLFLSIHPRPAKPAEASYVSPKGGFGGFSPRENFENLRSSDAISGNLTAWVWGVRKWPRYSLKIVLPPKILENASNFLASDDTKIVYTNTNTIVWHNDIRIRIHNLQKKCSKDKDRRYQS